MNIDFISDIHVDHHVRFLNEESVKDFIHSVWGSHVVSEDDILIVAGDISEYVDTSKLFFKILSEIKPYRKIFFTPGNHDLYYKQLYKVKSLTEKKALLFEELSMIDNLVCLDGQIVDLEGIRISGSSMWYSYDYLKNLLSQKELDNLETLYFFLWQKSIIDPQFMARKEIIPYFESEFEKFKKVSNDCDIFVSHINPIPYPEYMDPKFQGQPSNTFFCFDGTEVLKNSSIKMFFFGHTHSKLDKMFGETRMLCNAFGYPGEISYRDTYISSVRI